MEEADKGSTESEDETDDESRDTELQDDYKDLTEEDRLMQKEILRNYVRKTRKETSATGSQINSSRHTKMSMTHDSERISPNRISTFYVDKDGG